METPHPKLVALEDPLAYGQANDPTNTMDLCRVGRTQVGGREIHDDEL